MSYVSHSQIWAWQQKEQLYIAGKTNRASVGFEREMLKILEILRSDNNISPKEQLFPDFGEGL